jgi:alpha-beta hydrolase superfamily lysophospholipase
MTASIQTTSLPAHSYAEASERAQVFMARDDESILPQARTALLSHGTQRPLAVVLFHGFTNNPAQYAAFAPLVYGRGANVFIPRMPEHGDRDRMTTRLRNLTAEMVLASATEAVDIACGLGERVAVLGISMGGSLAAYFGQFRAIELAVPVAPDFALLKLPYSVSRLLARVVLRLPNFFLWWDPRAGIDHAPHTAYPRFSTHALMQTLRIGDEAYAAARQRPQLATRIVAIVNCADPAVNNEVTRSLASEWQGWNRQGVDYVELRDLPENHDIIDPENPLARTDLVYPRLLSALGY